MTTSIAFVLPAGSGSGEPVNFPGFPGAWTPGVPKAAADLVAAGAFESVEEVVARVAELGLPLERAKARLARAAETADTSPTVSSEEA